MRFLRELWEWLKSSPGKDHNNKWHPGLNPIDIQKISRELSLKADGQRLGLAGVPSVTNEKLTGPEAAVVFKIEEARTSYIRWGGLRLAGVNEELSRKDITKDINQASRADKEFERLASADLTAKEFTLRDLGDVARARKDEFDRFKRVNRLDRLPLVPQGNKKALMIVGAIALIAIEAFLNMTFFAKGLTTGLLGGFIEAAIAASVNVGVSLMFGMQLVRWIHHIKLLPKLLGILMCAVICCFILTMALGIAHYRDALVSGAANAMGLALQSLLTSPFSLQELSSWLLCFVSIAFGVIAVFDGYRTDDPYPGYGKTFRLADDAIQDYNAEIAELRDILEERKRQILDRLESAAKTAEASVAICDTVIGTKRRSGQELAVAIQGAESALHALLQEFRNENCIARCDKPVPTFFNTWPELRKLDMPNFDTSADEANVTSQRQLLATFLGDLENIRARIQTAFTTRFNSLQTLHAHFIPASVSTGDPVAPVPQPTQMNQDTQDYGPAPARPPQPINQGER
jgi:hypothetical protein